MALHESIQQRRTSSFDEAFPRVALTVRSSLVGILVQLLVAVAITFSAASWQTSHLVTDTTTFRKGNQGFEWRGISAFRLAEMIAHGREQEAVQFLDWAAAQKLTVVRVFLMAHHLFQLKPDEGRAALPRLLTLAAARGLYVEAVAFADTAEIPLDHDAHITSVGAIASQHANAIVEIANEPWHPTQHKRLHDPAYVKRLADLVPATVPAALGSAEGDAGYAAGRYVTWHSPRHSGDGGWQHVLAIAEGAKLMAGWRKPVISDEPIGAASAAVPGRRDSDPARFAAAAAVTRIAGLGATFHYEGGLQARIPAATELACFNAWKAGLELFAKLPPGGTFVSTAELSKIAHVRGARAAFGRTYSNAIWILVVDPAKDASATLRSGAKLEAAGAVPGARIFQGRR